MKLILQEPTKQLEFLILTVAVVGGASLSVNPFFELTSGTEEVEETAIEEATWEEVVEVDELVKNKQDNIKENQKEELLKKIKGELVSATSSVTIGNIPDADAP